MKIKVYVKNAGARRNTVEAEDFELSPDFDGQCTVCDFLNEITAVCVRQYKKRQAESGILHLLTEKQIEEKSSTGKISFGVNYGEKSPQLKAAQENTCQCYLDGIFALFIDGNEISGLKSSLPLESPVSVHEGSEVTFIRLAMLAGRMW